MFKEYKEELLFELERMNADNFSDTLHRIHHMTNLYQRLLEKEADVTSLDLNSTPTSFPSISGFATQLEKVLPLIMEKEKIEFPQQSLTHDKEPML